MPKMVSGYSENALNHKSGSPRKDRSDTCKFLAVAGLTSLLVNCIIHS